jgi:serine O-acetyltransferase
MSDRPLRVVAPMLPGQDPVWSRLRHDATVLAASEPTLASFVNATILGHERLEQALTYHLAQKLGNVDVGSLQAHEVFDQAYAAGPALGDAARADLTAIFDRDPAVDIHPAARIGSGVMIDHGTGVVIGETAVIEDDVSLLQGVTLGGTGKEHGDRHPKVRRGVMIGAGAKILGNTEIGPNSRIGAGSVVLRPVPPGSTAVGVPAQVIGEAGSEHPADEMDQLIEFGPEDYFI